MASLRSVGQAKINLLFFQDIITMVTGILILMTLLMSLNLRGGADDSSDPQIEKELSELRESLAKSESENTTAQEQLLKAAALPSRELLESQIAALRRETNAAARERLRSDAVADQRGVQEASANRERQRANQERENVVALEQAAANLRVQLFAARTNNALFIVPATDARQSPLTPVAFIVSADKLQLRRLDGTGGEDVTLARGVEFARALFKSLDPQRASIVLYFRPSGAKWFLPLREMARSGGFKVGYDAVEENQELIFARP